MIIVPMQPESKPLLKYISENPKCFFKYFKNGEHQLGLVQCIDEQGNTHRKIGICEGIEADVIADIIRNGVDFDDVREAFNE